MTETFVTSLDLLAPISIFFLCVPFLGMGEKAPLRVHVGQASNLFG